MSRRSSVVSMLVVLPVCRGLVADATARRLAGDALTRCGRGPTADPMQLGVMIRNMGPQSTRDVVIGAARAADACAAVSDVWVVDHVAIPPDDAEGSGGRYLDPLATL